MAQHNRGEELASLHRLPTLSAADALQEAAGTGLKPVSLGLEPLNALLQDHTSHHETCSGLDPGQIVEVFGPPGVGKTTLCLHAVADALHSGSKVLWIDTATPLVGNRLIRILSRYEDSDAAESRAQTPPVSTEEKLSRFAYYFAPTLPHLLALISGPSVSFPLDDTALVVIDSISTTIDNEYPRNFDPRNRSSQSDHLRWLEDRRPAAIAEITSRLIKLSSTRNVVIFLTSTTVTKIRVGNSALLRPALSGAEWEKMINLRLVLYRDWVHHNGNMVQSEVGASARFVELMVREPSGVTDKVQNVVALSLDESGMHAIDGALPGLCSKARPHKRRYEEIADSNEHDSSSDYGWDGDEDQLVAMDSVDAAEMRGF